MLKTTPEWLPMKIEGEKKKDSISIFQVLHKNPLFIAGTSQSHTQSVFIKQQIRWRFVQQLHVPYKILSPKAFAHGGEFVVNS